MPVARLDYKNHRLAAAALAMLFLLAMTTALRSAWDRCDELLHGDRYVDLSFGLEWPAFQVNAVEPMAERAGLRKGDVVLAVNGQQVQGWSGIFGPLRRARTGDRLLLHVKRNGSAGPKQQDISVPGAIHLCGLQTGRWSTLPQLLPAS